jgi:hypothetical protein
MPGFEWYALYAVQVGYTNIACVVYTDILRNNDLKVYIKTLRITVSACYNDLVV